MIVAGSVWLSAVGPVTAHGSASRIEVTPDRVPPGMTVVVRGVEFDIEEELAIELIGVGGIVPLGNAVAGVDRGFELAVVVPVETRSGEYRVSATAPDGHAVLTTMVVEGQPITEDDDDHGEDVIVVVTPAPDGPTAEPTTNADQRTSAAGTTDTIPLVAGVGALVVATILVIAYISRRPA